MSLLKNFLKISVNIISIIILGMLVFIICLNQLRYPDIYTNALEKSNFYSSIESNNNTLLNYISSPQRDLKSLINKKLENLLAYLRSDSEELDLKIQINKTLIKQEICGENKQINCKSINMSSEDLAKIPETIDIKDYDTQNKIPQLRKYLSYYYFIIFSLVVLFLFFILLVYILNKDSKKHFLINLGIIFTISGINEIVSSLLSVSLSQKILNQLTLDNVNYSSAIKSAFMSILKFIMARLMFFGIILITIGIIIIVISFFKSEVKK